ncbi:MAG: indole-3-glycerol phosphate synthase TrpC [Actinobacteria bacterium]|nr:indole-3-glycerol phosphate synthase TrpC [Actinomycetota bacterium]
MSVLDSIIEGVREDLAKRRKSLGQLHDEMSQAPAPLDAHPVLKGDVMKVIAEVKRSSPSKGSLSAIADPAALAEQYQIAGASVISVLTEERRFKGSLADLTAVRSRVSIPILRKDFMVDEYQFFEARAHGADMVLLIVAALAKSQLRDFYDLATDLGMAVLIEVHTADELERAMEISPRIVGVNSRNLKTLEVNPAAFAELIPRIPSEVIRVAESGISRRADVEFAQSHGADAILVGEALVTSADANLAMRALLGQG